MSNIIILLNKQILFKQVDSDLFAVVARVSPDLPAAPPDQHCSDAGRAEAVFQKFNFDQRRF